MTISGRLVFSIGVGVKGRREEVVQGMFFTLWFDHVVWLCGNIIQVYIAFVVRGLVDPFFHGMMVLCFLFLWAR